MSTTPDSSAVDLGTFGYTQQLSRRVGSYASFAAGFSFVSILTTVFQLFGLGFSFGGTAFFWTWPAVFAGQLMVALCFAELAARYPLSGAIYQWSRRLGGSIVGWFAGWTMVIAQIITVAAAAIALQVVLPAVWGGFQVIGSDPTLSSKSGASNAVLLGVILLVVTTTLNAVSVRITAIVNSIGVTCELIGVVLLAILLFGHAERGPSVVLHTTNLDNTTGYVVPLLISALMAAYVLVGFDSAGELAEETHKPRATTPRTIIRAVVASGLGGAFLIIAALMAAPSVTDGNLGLQGLPYVLTSQLGTTTGKLLLLDVAFAVCVCTLAIQTAAARMIYSMARDNVLPYSKQLAKVSPKTGTPVLATVVPGVLAGLCLVVNVGNAGLFLGLASVCIMLLYIAYLLVTAPLLYRRITGTPLLDGLDENGKKLFSLGRFGIVVNAIAVVYGIAMAINLAMPRAEVYDPAGEGWYLHYLPLITLAVVGLGGVAAYAVQRKDYHRSLGEPVPSFSFALPGLRTAEEEA
ncbi:MULTISPECIES: amino acid permease [unclassified Nocardioides]|uniref:amino acid permease n=1 Tax=unclassified Nocardioides TaxID=2615069 RepID=UPI0006FDE027|nr:MULTISPECIES: amino acid permease [unclassified Nocardioides]KRA32508.1 amino acid permease [Nocardioides sp. Root614]KRA89162.1 amino acid permease [Nocardioides sp. Root682]